MDVEPGKQMVVLLPSSTIVLLNNQFKRNAFGNFLIEFGCN